MDRRETGHNPSQIEEELLLSLSENSTLLVVLRALYSLMLDYGVYLTDRGDALVFSKSQMEQLVLLGGQGQSDTPLKELPRLMEEGLFRPVVFEGPEEMEGLEDASALVLERRGARVIPLTRAINPDEMDYPEWWEAPIPFALCGRGRLKLNPTALLLFGPELERLNAVALPEKDEFIVELEGKGKPCFLAFRRLEPNVFTIDDCTGDLVEAQDISWWAAVGRAWTSEIEARGQTWRRVDSLPEGFEGQSWPCEWQGRFLGYLCVEDIASASVPPQAPTSNEDEDELEKEKPRRQKKPTKSKKRPRKVEQTELDDEDEEEPVKKEDEVLKALGPQTMALLAAGQTREDWIEPEPEPAPLKKLRGRSRKGSK